LRCPIEQTVEKHKEVLRWAVTHDAGYSVATSRSADECVLYLTFTKQADAEAVAEKFDGTIL
jgi:hypothetical protein